MSQGPSSATEDRVSQSLTSAIDLYGPGLLREPQRLRARLESACPGATREIAALVAGVAAQVPQTMMAADAIDDASLGLPALVERLMKQASLDRPQARWVVRTWARAMAVSAKGLDDASAATRGAVVANHHSSVAEVLGFGAQEVSRRTASVGAEPRQSRTNEPVTPHEPIAVRSAREAVVQASSDRLVAAPADRFVAAPNDHAVAGHGVAVPALADDDVAERTDPPEVRRPAPFVERRDSTPLPLGSIVEPVADPEPVGEPVEARPEATSVAAVERSEAVSVRGEAVPSGEAVVQPTSDEAIPAAAAPVVAEVDHAMPAAVEPAVASAEVDAASKAVRPEAAAPAPQTAAVQAATSPTGGVKPPGAAFDAAASGSALRPTAPADRARPRVPRLAIVGVVIVVALAVAWAVRSSGRRAVDLTAPIAAPSTAPTSAPSTASTPAPSTATPTPPAPAPVVPAATAPSVNAVVAGDGPTVAPSRETTVESSTPPPPSSTDIANAKTAAGKARPKTPPLDASRAAAHADRSVAAVPAKRTATDEHPARKPSACTRADCGSVVATRPVPGDARNFEMTIRMDDRSIHTLVQPLPLRPGTRMRMTNNRFVSAGAS